MHEFYKNKKVLITGHNGFKGSWLSIILLHLGAEVIGYSLADNKEKDNFVVSGIGKRMADINGDIRDYESLAKVFEEHKPDIVFHLAAQPIVRISYKNPRETYETNVMGTLNVLECIRQCPSVRESVIITTDKCYENKEQFWGYRETDPLGGYDPYSASKACAEILVHSYVQSFANVAFYEEHKKAIATARAGNVIGGGDWAVDRLIPDCVRAIENDKAVILRNPMASRPWQHVLEPLFGYLTLAYKMSMDPAKFSGAWNFGPDRESVVCVEKVVGLFCKHFSFSNIQLDTNKNPHETTMLSLDNTKAKLLLGWKPMFGIEETVRLTAQWYEKYKYEDTHTICMEQIKTYESLLEKN